MKTYPILYTSFILILMLHACGISSGGNSELDAERDSLKVVSEKQLERLDNYELSREMAFS